MVKFITLITILVKHNYINKC
ncbi:hypothetical protein VCEC0012_000546, partial [Vibrio cholerae O1 str. EC-0012]